MGVARNTGEETFEPKSPPGVGDNIPALYYYGKCNLQALENKKPFFITAKAGIKYFALLYPQMGRKGEVPESRTSVVNLLKTMEIFIRRILNIFALCCKLGIRVSRCRWLPDFLLR
jgi:hypothetical protein